MKNSKIFIYIFIFIAFALIIGFFIFNNTKNNNQQANIPNNTTATRTSYDVNEEQAENRISNIIENQNEINKNQSNETEISSYSTTIKDKEQGRLTNISITCSTLNNTIVPNGQSFSFNQTIGQPTVQKGYKEASIIINHKTEKGIGGGNCQVSSTLYNAVLAVSSLTITERHEHGKDVTYVPEGKDAAVSYGSLDFKFKNNSGKDIRIEATTDNQTITIKLIHLS